MSIKNISVKEDTRFVIYIDENFDRVTLKDLNASEEKLGINECNEILQSNFDEIVKLVESLEQKVYEKKRIINKIKTYKNLRIVK